MSTASDEAAAGETSEGTGDVLSQTLTQSCQPLVITLSESKLNEDGAPFDSGFDDTGPFRVTPESGGVSLESALRDFGPAAIDDLIPRLRAHCRRTRRRAPRRRRSRRPSSQQSVRHRRRRRRSIAGDDARASRRTPRRKSIGGHGATPRPISSRWRRSPTNGCSAGRSPHRRSADRGPRDAGRRSRRAVEGVYARARAEARRSFRLVRRVLRRACRRRSCPNCRCWPASKTAEEDAAGRGRSTIRAEDAIGRAPIAAMTDRTRAAMSTTSRSSPKSRSIDRGATRSRRDRSASVANRADAVDRRCRSWNPSADGAGRRRARWSRRASAPIALFLAVHRRRGVRVRGRLHGAAARAAVGTAADNRQRRRCTRCRRCTGAGRCLGCQGTEAPTAPKAPAPGTSGTQGTRGTQGTGDSVGRLAGAIDSERSERHG